jgi:hypothetical protein
MDRLKELIESARIERVKDVVLCPTDRRKAPLSVTENFMAMLRSKGRRNQSKPGISSIQMNH